MSKAVLISIQPKWCELIASGKKTIEVRKTKPKIPTPFKVYIYCTKARIPIRHNGRILMYEDDLAITNRWEQGKRVENPFGTMMDGELFLNGKVIGEFVCDEIVSFGFTPYNHSEYIVSGDKEKKRDVLKESCLSFNDMYEYIGEEFGYAWHISDLKIYDKPKELGEFFCACKQPKGTDCSVCRDNREYTCKSLTHPPQSWCYVERLVEKE